MSLTLHKIGDILAQWPRSFIQQWEGSGTTGKDDEHVTRCSTFRVCMYANGKIWDAIKPTIHEAIHEAFEGVGVDVPPELAKAFPKPPAKKKATT